MPYLSAQLDAVEGSMPFRVVGTVQGISGMTIEASDLTLPLGSLCRIDSFGGRASSAEVVGFRQDRTLLMTALVGLRVGLLLMLLRLMLLMLLRTILDLLITRRKRLSIARQIRLLLRLSRSVAWLVLTHEL